MLCRDFFKLYHLPFTILRYGTVYGPESRNEDVISIFVKRALHHQPLVIHGDGNQTRNFIFVDDAAEGSVAVLQEKAKNKTYYLEGSEQVSINKVVTLIKEILGDVKIEYQKARYDDFKGKALSTEFNLNELNWEPRIDFKEGLTRYIAWYMKKNKITSKRY
jgi:UDP-glucose 4-epimerase